MYYVDFVREREDVQIPTRGSSEAAGWDLYAWSYGNFTYDEKEEWAVVIPPKATLKVNTGIYVAIPDGCFGGIYARSGLATKQGLAPANKVGIIDSDYRGQLIVALYNHSDLPVTLHKGDRVAQLIVQPYIRTQLVEVKELDETERGDGGFGSTGTN